MTIRLSGSTVLARLFVVFVWCSQQRRACYQIFVAAFDQRDALSASSCFANLIDPQTDELCLLCDDHDLAVVFHGERRNDLAGLIGRLHIDDADAAAFGEAIAFHLGLLAET